MRVADIAYALPVIVLTEFRVHSITVSVGNDREFWKNGRLDRRVSDTLWTSRNKLYLVTGRLRGNTRYTTI